MRKPFFRSCSLFLVLVLLVNMLPVNIFAEEYQTDRVTAAAEAAAQTTDAQIVAEVMENRTEYTKEFKLDNGLFTAAVYSNPVHYLQDGQWTDIDNTLKTSTDGVFTNTAGVWNILLPQQLNQRNPISVIKDGYTLSFNMAGELRQQGNLEVAGMIPEIQNTTLDTALTVTEEETVTEATEPTETTPETLSPETEPIPIESPATEPITEETEPVPTEAPVTEPTIEETEPTSTETPVTDPTVEETEPEEAITETQPEETIPETLPPETEPIPTDPPATEPTVPQETVALVPSEETTTVSINGVTQTFAVKSAQAAIGRIQSIDLTEAKESAEYEEYILEKNASQLMYTNVYQNTNIQYDLQGNTLKESIILNTYNSTLRGYRYTLNVGEMVPVLNDDGSIYFYDKNGEQIVMVIEAPYLVDEADAISTDVRVSLTGSGSTYTLIYLLPTAWLASAERTWPVVLDPVITTEPDAVNIRDHTVASNGTYSHLRKVLECGYGSSSHVQRFFIKYRELPPLTSSDVIVNAAMHLYKPENSDSVITVDVHKVEETWESETLTWDNKPAHNTKIEDYALINLSGYYSWDVTDIVRDWYQGTNTGMMFKASDQYEDGSASTWKQFCSADNYNYKPTLTIVYRNNNGLESYWDYTSSSVERAGTGYVNSYTGNMVWVRNDMGFGGNRMPVSISHVYNLNDSANNDFGLGYGWRTNFNQRVYQWDENSNYYVWEDGDGTDHYFLYESAGIYKDEDGLELTLKTDGSGTQNYSITDKNGNISFFDTKGRLTSQKNNQETPSSITVTYTTTSGLLIDKITDGAGRVYDFTYSNNLLSSIRFLGSGSTALATTTFTYSSSNLTQVKDTDNGTSNYIYTCTGHILTVIQGLRGVKLQYEYYAPTESHQPYRVKKISNFSGTVAGGTLELEYAHNQTTFKDHNGNVEIMQFNDFGNTVSIQDNEGHAQYSKYAINNASESGNANQLRLSSKMQNTVSNVFWENSFEISSTWTYVSGSGSRAISNTQAYEGKNSLAITNDLVLKSGDVAIPAGKTYTFSAYVKTVGTTAKIMFHDGTNTYESILLPAGRGWTRLEATYTNKTNAAVTVTARIQTAGTGTTYVDCNQWEQSPTASRFNLVVNGEFRHNNIGWSSYSGRTTQPPASPKQTANVYKMTGNAQATNRISQTVQVKGSAGDTFVLAGWAKGDSAPLPEAEEGENQRQFGIIGTFTYTDGATKSFTAQFNPDTDSSNNWQYSAEVMVAEKAYKSITVELAYDYNVNEVWFDGIQLYREQFGSSYTYDENGNVKSVVDLQKKNTTYEYDDNNLTQIIENGKAKMTYTYDEYHNVIQAVTDEEITYTFTYDDWGNNTSVSIVSGSTKITSTATYSNNGNTLASTTDALGNETTYGYNANTNVLNWVQYPEDTTATRTTYTYDNMYRMATASVTTDAGDSLSASYTYTNDLLTGIQTNSTAYTFTYGNFGLRTRVKAGDHTLATYTYTNDQNKDLQKLAYGNEDSVQYTYDSKGRVLTQTYEDGNTLTYQYDNDGNLATSTDSATEIKTTYFYDFVGRLRRTEERSPTLTRNTNYIYDANNNLTAFEETNNGTWSKFTYNYDSDNRLSKVTYFNASTSYGYDDFGRLESRTTNNVNVGDIVTESFSYKANSTQVQSMTSNTNGNRNVTYEYTYDKNGNITAVFDGTYTTSYVYDSANQLIRENNQAGNFTYTWTYDDAGNIQNRKEYVYTTGTLGTPQKTVTYSYNDADSWGDLLTGYNGNVITYDEIGNPTSDGTWNYTWEHGRRLESMSDGSETWQFSYDTDGLRTKRTNGSTTYTYRYNGDNLRQMKIVSGGQTVAMSFIHNADGPMLVGYNGTLYYYTKNLQGDITGLVDSNGNSKVEYTYDAWGNVTISGELSDSLGKDNPFRYRGYVYDEETNLYYLQSRYYNPEVGRFLNADGLASTGQGLLGNNMFAYCLNNSVMHADPTGMCTYIGYAPWMSANGTYLDCGRGDCPTSENYFPITSSMGLSGSITFGPYVYGAQIALVTDSLGYSELQFTYFLSLSSSAISGSPSVDEMLNNIRSIDKITDILEFSLMGNVSFCNAPFAENLYGTAYQVGGALGTGSAIAVDYNIIPNGTDNPYRGITISGGMGTSDIHGAMGSTMRLARSPVSVYDLASAAYNGIWGR